MSFFEELKRRNVFRVGAAYAVAAWVLLQILDVVGEILELPNWGGRLVLALLAVGFVVVLFGAWAYELTPEGVKRERDVDRSQSITHQTGKKLNLVIIGLMGLAIAYLLFDKFYLAPRLNIVENQTASVEAVAPVEPAPVAATETEPPPISPRSIAVLPFENRSRQEDDAFFVEGIHDDLLTSLARIGSLKVISRTSVSKYSNTEKSLPEIASELGVATVMEGAVQRSGNTVRINVQLIDATTDEHLWAEIFDRELTAENLFAIQSEISEEIARALQATLSPQEQQRLEERPTENLAAYNAYLRGRQLLARRNSEAVDQAAGEFQRAVELDPEFALAWVGVSEAALLRSLYSDLPRKEAIEMQQSAAERALALDDQLGEAWLARADVANYYDRDEEAETAYLKAIELSPGYATAWQWYSGMLSNYPHRLGESVELLQKALELDPLSSIIHLNLAALNIALGRYEMAESQLERLRELDPNFVLLYSKWADLEFVRGQWAERVRWTRKAIEMDPGNMGYYVDLMWAYFDLGYLDPLDDIRQTMVEINPQNPMIGMVDLIPSIYSRNFDGALETARWTFEGLGRPPWFQRIIGYINAMKGDYAQARIAFEAASPRYFQRDQWREAIQADAGDGCFAGLLMLRTGEPQKGEELLRSTLDYLENELPRYIEHADRYAIEDCYIALGRTEDAIAAIETRFDHGHNLNTWWLRNAPIYEPLRSEPRFQAALQRMEKEIAEQRAELINGETIAL